MKANELMIGDYISVKPSGMPIKVAAVHHKKVAYHAVVNKLAWVRESLLESIPLTEEILEKNGFVNKNDEWVHYCDFPFIDFTLNKDSNGFYIDYVPNGYINYVYELQHDFELNKNPTMKLRLVKHKSILTIVENNLMLEKGLTLVV